MKKTLFAIIILIVTFSYNIADGMFSVEKAKLSGVVTYKESYQSSNHPDPGSEIYAITEADLRSTGYDYLPDMMGNFEGNKSDFSLSTYNTIDPASIKKSQDKLNTMSNFVLKYISEFKKLPAVVKTATNSAGRYALSLRPGKYYILVVSGSVNGNNTAEAKGKIDFTMVNVKPAVESLLNFKFEKQQMIWVVPMTRKPTEGC
ncbi:MAG: hypothetical protein WCL00_08100 [Bacteroidota bacterium]